MKRRGFFDALVGRPVTLLVLFTALLVIGLISYARIPLQLMPDGIVSPGLYVSALHPGASAQENEEKVARPVEEQMRTLSGIEHITSYSREDSCGFWIEFDASMDMDLAKAEVRDRIERARSQLPDTVQEIGIYSSSMDQIPIFWMPILHPGDSDRTDFLIDSVIKRRLEAVDGVGRVDIGGVLDDSIRILLDEDRVFAANLDLGDLIRRLSSDNFAQPLGEVTDGGSRILLRSDMRFETPEEIEDYPIGNGLRIRDVGRVIAAKSVRDYLVKLDGSYSFEVEILKDSQANTVQTCKRVVAAVAELEADPRLADFQFLPLWNQGQTIEDSLGQLRETALWGGGLAVLVLLIFLRRLRMTLCVALSIPFSIILAVGVSYFSGGTFNLLTMCGITLALGMLVDNSVVVIENIARLRSEGHDRRTAAVRGTSEVALAVTLATMTTIVVFLPVIFMTRNPILAKMFGELGLPLCIALAFSLLAALIFLPAAASRIAGPRHPAMERVAAALVPIASLPARLVGLITGGLRYCLHLVLVAARAIEAALLGVLTPLRWALAAGALGLGGWAIWRTLAGGAHAEELELVGLAEADEVKLRALGLGLTAVLAAGLLAFGLRTWRRMLPGRPRRPERLVPAGSSLVDFLISSNRALVGWSLRHRPAAMLLASTFVLSAMGLFGKMEMAAFGEEESTERLTVQVELEDNFTLAEADEQMRFYEDFFQPLKETYGYEHLSLRFDPTGGRVRLYWAAPQGTEALERIRREVAAALTPPPGHKVQFYEDQASADSRSKTAVSWRLVGPESEELDAFGMRAIALLEGLPGLQSLSSPGENAPGQVRVVMDSDQANSFGITAESALQNIAWALRGWQLPRFQEEGREIPLILEYDEEELAGLSTLRELQLFTGEGVVPLTSFAELDFARGSREITRRDGQVSFTITGTVESPLRQREVSDAGYELLRRELDLPRGYSIGEEDLISRRTEEEFTEISLALLFSIVLVFMLMAILFESWLLPLSVMFTIPFAIAGAIWTLYVTGTEMDSVGWIGMIILVGVVVNNGIVLVDRIHSLAQRTTDRAAAVLQGSATRVRPIVMTALTTVIGLLPMATSEPSGEGIDYRALATCVAGGLAISTFFTLWVVPLAYTLIDDLGKVLLRHVHWALGLARRLAERRRSPAQGSGDARRTSAT